MAQFTLHRNIDPATAERFPFLLDVQADLLTDLATRVVIPLIPRDRYAADTIWTLTPDLFIEGSNHVLLTPQITHLPRRNLGPAVKELGSDRSEVLAALDLLVQGL